MLKTGYYQLSDSFPVVNGKSIIRQIHKNDLYFSAIVCIYGSGRIKYGYSEFCSQTAAGSYLSLKPLGKGYKKPGGYKSPFKRLQDYGLAKVGAQIQSCRLACGILRKGMM